MAGIATPTIITQKRGRDFAKDYNTIDLAETPDVNLARIESWIAKRIGTKLTKLFPNRDWWVKVDMKGGMVIVGCPSVSPRHGYHIKLSRSINEIEDMLETVGGEILERGRLTRGKTTEELVEAAVRDFRDQIVDLDHG